MSNTKVDLIIETDLGRDADDFFAICYLAAAGVNIVGLTLTPGHDDQVCLATWLLRELGFGWCSIGVPEKRDMGKFSVTPFHHEIMAHYGNKYRADFPYECGEGGAIIDWAMNMYPDAELFCIGPVTNVHEYLTKYPNAKRPERATMQGGFCSYDLSSTSEPLLKFKDCKTVPTFNLNGDKKGGQAFIDEPTIKRQFVGKNVCHSIFYDEKKNEEQMLRLIGKPSCSPEAYLKINELSPAMRMFALGAHTYLKRHPEKKFHDPTAAVCHLHPEIATWVKGKTYYEKGGWGTRLDANGDDICVDIDRNKLWEHLFAGT